jgi:hypothetical protein
MTDSVLTEVEGEVLKHQLRERLAVQTGDG